MQDAAESLTASEHASSMDAYVSRGEQRAMALGNRGPLRYDDDGRVASDILEAYWKHGFYVFEGVINPEEVTLLREEALDLLDRAPVSPDAIVDAAGQPSAGQGFTRPSYTFIKPLSDPWGGTELLGGRHQTQMRQPLPDHDAPEYVVYLMHGMCQTMKSGLRLYGHPDLMSIAAAINGDDFVPFNDATFVKQPMLGGSVAWHQDGVTHWDNPEWDSGIHGFNFQVQLFQCTARNCLWVVPETHTEGRIDIKARVAANGGSEMLPGAVPLLCQPGDVTVVNRQALHCSFANTSKDLRLSLTFGFHRRRSVLGAQGALGQKSKEVYDEQRIFDRSGVIQVAIDARSQFYPEERRFAYEPFQGLEDQFRFCPEVFDQVIRDYNLKDLSI